MTQIANVRRFDGTDDWVRFTTPAAMIASFGAITMAAILKINTDPADGAFRDIFTLTGGTGGQMGFVLENPAGASTTGPVAYFDPSASVFGIPSYADSTMGWIVLGMSKPAGDNQTARAHLYRYDTTTWNHTSIGASDIDAGTAPSGSPVLRAGTWNETIEFLAADVAVMGWWQNTELSDADFETLPDGIDAWTALSPTWLTLWNQTSVTDPVLDISSGGTGDESARNGTTVTSITVSELPFDVGGEDTGLAWITA